MIFRNTDLPRTDICAASNIHHYATSPPPLSRNASISIHINNWNNVRPNKYLLRTITNVNFRRYSAFRCRKVSWDRSRACHAFAFVVKKKQRGRRTTVGRRTTREIDKFDEAPLFRRYGRSLSACFFHLFFFTPDERRSAVMHDKKFNVRRRRGRWEGVGEREEAGDGERGKG